MGFGCSTQKFATMRSMPINPLATQLYLFSRSGPRVSDRTQMLLRRYDLLSLYQRDASGCLAQLQVLSEQEHGGEAIYAVSELAYTLGQRYEREGKAAKALDMYSVSVSNAYLYLFAPVMDASRNPYDPQFRGACDLYNGALESTLRLVNKAGQLKPGASYRISTEHKDYEVAVVMRGPWHDEDFERIEFCNDYDIEGLETTNITYGIGVPLIAVRQRHNQDDVAENYYPDGLSFPVTALLRVTAPGVQTGSTAEHRHHCVLELYDPLDANDIQLASRMVPLQTDLSTPLAYFLDNEQFRKQTNSTIGLINPNKSQEKSGIYMLEPFDPNRIPVLMVHGLWSSPLTWMPMFNDLRSFQELRRNYQFWFYQYPTGQPFWISATQMRADLAELRAQIDPQHQAAMIDQMVLVGHSMGGLVSRMQTLESGDEFWKILSDRPFEDVEGKREDVAKLASALFFKPNPSVQRVITIGTPHRGSDYANDYTRWIGRKIIKLPTTMTDTGHRLARQNPELFRETGLLTTNTSIDSLSPDSPIFPVMLRAPRGPWVRYHNVIGVVPDEGFFNRFSEGSDGVVDFASAHMDDVESEIMVEAQHQDIHRTPRAILEVRRILKEHLNGIRASGRMAGGEEGMRLGQTAPRPLPEVVSPVQPASATVSEQTDTRRSYGSIFR
jgi:pimeloyl-ACP methyl ester carboxylesterase